MRRFACTRTAVYITFVTFSVAEVRARYKAEKGRKGQTLDAASVQYLRAYEPGGHIGLASLFLHRYTSSEKYVQ